LRRTPGVTLISASAGFGKTTLVSEWVAGARRRLPGCRWTKAITNPPAFDLPGCGDAADCAYYWRRGLGCPSVPQPPPAESILTSLLNEIAAVPHLFILVLDDYHAIEAQAVDQALAFVIKHLPPHMHLVIVSREDPDLPWPATASGAN